MGAAGTKGLQGGETEAPCAQTQPPVYQGERSLGSKLGLDPPHQPQWSPAQSLAMSACHRAVPKISPTPREAQQRLRVPAARLRPRSKGSPGISPRRSAAPKNAVSSRNAWSQGGAAAPGPLLSPSPAAAAARPQHEGPPSPPALAASPSCSHAPDFLPGGPRPPAGFSHGSRSTRRSLRPCERQTGWRGSARVGRQPAAARSSCASPPKKKKSSSSFSPTWFPTLLLLF